MALETAAQASHVRHHSQLKGIIPLLEQFVACYGESR
jgi:hypothetical protein